MIASRARSRAALALAVAGAAAVACGPETAPATPAITPGTAAAPRQVNVILKDYLFVPGVVDLVPGETIALNVVNGGLDVHELVLGPRAVQDAWAAAEAPVANPPPGPTPAISVAPGLAGLRIVARSGETQSVTWTVPDDAATQLLLGCHIADHYQRGMAGAVRFVGPGGTPLGSGGAPSGPGDSPLGSGPP